jgi:hypothetical protein
VFLNVRHFLGQVCVKFGFSENTAMTSDESEDVRMYLGVFGRMCRSDLPKPFSLGHFRQSLKTIEI